MDKQIKHIKWAIHKKLKNQTKDNIEYVIKEENLRIGRKNFSVTKYK